MKGYLQWEYWNKIILEEELFKRIDVIKQNASAFSAPQWDSVRAKRRWELLLDKLSHLPQHNLGNLKSVSLWKINYIQGSMQQELKAVSNLPCYNWKVPQKLSPIRDRNQHGTKSNPRLNGSHYWTDSHNARNMKWRPGNCSSLTKTARELLNLRPSWQQIYEYLTWPSLADLRQDQSGVMSCGRRCTLGSLAWVLRMDFNIALICPNLSRSQSRRIYHGGR